MWGAPLKGLSGWLPPMNSQDFKMSTTGSSNETTKINSKYSDFLKLPLGLQGYFDFNEAKEAAIKAGKPLFIDFTGHGCVNCRKMEEKVWSDPAVLKMLKEDFVVVSLYVDDKSILLPSNQQFTTHPVKKSPCSAIKTLTSRKPILAKLRSHCIASSMETKIYLNSL